MSQSDGHRDETYRALPDADGEPVGGPEPDGADEKLLSKEGSKARVVSNMADAKYKSEVNGEAKIEIDAGKRLFTGLTKEELLKYQDDPFWVRLRWLMFVLFWALWLAMLAGAIVIIVQSPKCPKPKNHSEKNAMVIVKDKTAKEVEDKLALMNGNGVRSVLVPQALLGDLYDGTMDLQPLKKLAEKANTQLIKVYVEVLANSVNKSHPWFVRSEKREEEFDDYFIWADGKPNSQPPNNWVSQANEPAWGYSEVRKQYYLHQLSSDTADLNFRNAKVKEAFGSALKEIVGAGVGGVRLLQGQLLLVEPSLKDDTMAAHPGDAVHTEYRFYSHRPTSNQPGLAELLALWRTAAGDVDKDAVVFLSGTVPPQTQKAEGEKKEEEGFGPLPPFATSAEQSPEQIASLIRNRVGGWPSIEVEGTDGLASELAVWTLLLPATPILQWEHAFVMDNDTWQANAKFKEVNQLRQKADLHHAETTVQSLANNTLLALTRSDAETGYLSVFNPTASESTVDTTALKGVPSSLTSLDGVDTFDAKSVKVAAQSTSVFLYKPVAEN